MARNRFHTTSSTPRIDEGFDWITLSEKVEGLKPAATLTTKDGVRSKVSIAGRTYAPHNTLCSLPVVHSARRKPLDWAHAFRGSHLSQGRQDVVCRIQKLDKEGVYPWPFLSTGHIVTLPQSTLSLPLHKLKTRGDFESPAAVKEPCLQIGWLVAQHWRSSIHADYYQLQWRRLLGYTPCFQSRTGFFFFFFFFFFFLLENTYSTRIVWKKKQTWQTTAKWVEATLQVVAVQMGHTWFRRP